MEFNPGHALLIGVDAYQHAPWLDVPIAARDAQAVGAILTDSRYCGYPTTQVQGLSGANASRAKILAALERLAGQTQPEDTVFIFHCGHGDYGTDENYYLLSYDSKIEADKVSSGTGIHEGELLEKIRAIPAQRLLVVFNSCHSGEISPNLGTNSQISGQNLPGITAEALLSAGSGRVVITACREQQFSWIGSGRITIFTQALVDGLHGKGIPPRGGFISLFDLYTSTFEAVYRNVEERLGERQEPELTILKGVGPFAVALHQGSTGTNMSLAEQAGELPTGPGVRQVDPQSSLQAYSQIISQSGGIHFGGGNRVEIDGNLAGGDYIDNRGASGVIQHARGPVEQLFDQRVNTDGGAYISGSVTVTGGDFIGRDKIVNQHPSGGAVTLEAFFALLEQLHARLDETQLEGKIKSVIESELASIRLEAQDDEPSLPILETRLTGLKNLLEKAGGVLAASSGLADVIQQAITLAQKLFK